MLKKKMLLGGLMATCSGMALAKVEEKANFRLSHNVLNYTMTTSKVAPDGGTETTLKSNEFVGYSGSWEMLAMVGKWNFYAYPGQPGNTLGIGYMLNDKLEVGTKLGYESSKTDPKTTTSGKYALGVYAVYYQPLGTNMLEAHFAPTLAGITNESTDAATGLPTKSNVGITKVSLGFDYVCNFSKNFHMVHGLDITMTTATEKEAPAKGKKSSTAIDLRLLGLRYEI